MAQGPKLTGKGWISVREASEKSGYGKMYIRERCRSGEITAQKDGEGRWKVKESTVPTKVGARRVNRHLKQEVIDKVKAQQKGKSVTIDQAVDLIIKAQAQYDALQKAKEAAEKAKRLAEK